MEVTYEVDLRVEYNEKTRGYDVYLRGRLRWQGLSPAGLRDIFNQMFLASLHEEDSSK